MNKFKKIIVYFLDVIGVLALVLYGVGRIRNHRNLWRTRNRQQ